VAQLRAAIAGQEKLRSTLGDAVVDAAVAALRQQLATVQGDERAQSRGEIAGPRAELASHALASLRSHLPKDLAAKARAAGWSEGERRQVTLLFADLSGFTALSERADPELIRTFQNDLFTELARIIYQYEGFVEKFVGDAVLAVFGAPVTHEDDPERALRVALAMRARMAALNRRWHERLGAPVTLHVGINTGPVVAGKFASDPDGRSTTYAVTGDTVNTASRLQDAAEPGQILVSRTTYRLAQGAFTFQALEPIQVRNRSEPLAVYELLRARPLPGKLRGIQELGEAFVGREDALAQLQAVTDSLAETGRIVLITGDAGIGKSRLIAEWRKRSQDTVRWLEGRCFAHTTNLSYGPFLDMLRRFAGIVDDDTDRRARQRLDAAVERLFPGEREAQAILASLLAMRLHREESAVLAALSDPRVLRERIFGLIERLVRRLAQERPLVLFLEDMQWADASTVELVQHLLPLTAGEPLVILVAGRPDPDSPIGQLETAAAGAHGERLVRIALDRLSDSSSLTMVRDLLATPELPPNLASLIRDRADGNPFFVEEIIRTLIEQGALRREGDRWSSTPLMETISVPDTLQGLIMARIDRLPDETKEVVQHAAVIGRTFLYRVLLAIAQASPSLDADLTHLERSELIRERTREPEVEYTFKHALTQEVAYQSLLSDRVREFHRRVGEAMERIFAGRLGEFYSIVADHFRKGEVWDKAADYEIKAGDHASQLFATEARAHYERALEALERLRPTLDNKRRRLDVTIGLAREMFFGPAAAAGLELDAFVERLKAAEPVAASLVTGARRGAQEDQLRQARLYAWLANAYSLHSQPRALATYLDKALAITDEIDDPELEARIGQVLVHQGHFRRAASFLTLAVGRLEEQGRWLDWVHANGVLACAEAARGGYRAGVQRAERGLMRAEKLRGPNLIDAANLYVAMVLLLGGEYDRARDALERRATDAGRPLNPRGQYIRQMLSHWYDEARPVQENVAHLVSHHLDGQQPGADGDHGQVHPSLRHWHDAFVAGVAVRAERHTDAVRAAEQTVRQAQELGNIFGEGMAWRYLALALAGQDPDDPRIDQHMRRSVDLLTSGECQLEAARTLVAWGDLGLKRRDPDAPARLREALRIFEQAELSWEVDYVQGLLAAPQA
jgi:class 3 adenylate cyclase/tetratricopeptide (TPR) repeat protein